MANTPLYDRSYRIPVILDLSDLKAEDAQDFLASIADYNPLQLSYISDFAEESLKEMGQQGYPSFSKPMPYNLTSTELLQCFARSIKRMNSNGYVRREPDASRLDKHVATKEDLVRLIEDLTLQQDSITLSQLFGTAELGSNVYYTFNRTPINGRLSHTVICVPKGSSKKSTEERTRNIRNIIDNGIKLSKEEQNISFTKEPQTNFRYR